MSRLIVLFFLSLMASIAVAQDSGSDTQLNEPDIGATLADALAELNRGERENAFARLRTLIDYYNNSAELSAEELVIIATAAQHLGVVEPQLYKDAVRVFDEAIASDPNNIDARIALGNLLLEKYNSTEAVLAFREALAIDPEHPGALLGLARSQHFDFSSQALETVSHSLEIDPQLVAARVFRARLFIELEQYDSAYEDLAKALDTDGGDLQALAVLASANFLTGKDAEFEQTLARVLALNPRYAELYNTLAELAARNRLYREAVDFASQAVQLDETSWRAYGLLGTNQLRTGAIAEGISNLEKSFAGDPYNVWIKNTLDLADTFTEYDTLDQERFSIITHSSESAVLAPYIRDLAEEAYDFYRSRYGYQPPEKIRIEFYPRHADFSVRTVGLGGIGILGVSFGPVLAMDSPSARQAGHFNWGSTLWHELAHTFHLGMTRNRVPRWFSEGLAVYEERQARPGWGGDVSIEFLQAYRDGKLLPVSELNNGFLRPSYPEQVIYSYYQASLVFDFIVSEWGFDVIRRMLEGFNSRLSSAELIEQILGLEETAFDKAFDDYFRARFARTLAAVAPISVEMSYPGTPAEMVRRAYWEPGRYALQLEAGRYLLSEDDLQGAELFLRRARDLFPEYGGDNNAYWLLAEIYERKSDPLQAEHQLRSLVSINGEHYQAYLKLGELRRILDDQRGAAEVLQQAVYINPYDIKLHQRLAGLYAALNNWPRAVAEMRAVVALKPVDMAEAHYQLANAYFKNEDAAAARMEILKSLEIAPNYEQGLELLLAIHEQL